MDIKQLYNDNLRKLPNEYGDVSVMMNARKRRGSRTLPCGTPERTSASVDMEPSSNTCSFLLLTKDWVQCRVSSRTP